MSFGRQEPGDGECDVRPILHSSTPERAAIVESHAFPLNCNHHPGQKHWGQTGSRFLSKPHFPVVVFPFSEMHFQPK